MQLLFNDLLSQATPNLPLAEVTPHVDRAAELNNVWQCETGQMWEIPSRKSNGSHFVIIGDCTIDDDVKRLLSSGTTIVDAENEGWLGYGGTVAKVWRGYLRAYED